MKKLQKHLLLLLGILFTGSLLLFSSCNTKRQASAPVARPVSVARDSVMLKIPPTALVSYEIHPGGIRLEFDKTIVDSAKVIIQKMSGFIIHESTVYASEVEISLGKGTYQVQIDMNNGEYGQKIRKIKIDAPLPSDN